YDAYGHTYVCYENWTSNDDGTAYDNVILFAGYYRDPETWFYHVRNRFYHAELGRFLQRDPIGYADGMSLYEYVGSNPMHMVDPAGTAKKCVPRLLLEAGAKPRDNLTNGFGAWYWNWWGQRIVWTTSAEYDLRYSMSSSNTGVTVTARASGWYFRWYWVYANANTDLLASATGKVTCYLRSDGTCEAFAAGGGQPKTKDIWKVDVRVKVEGSGDGDDKVTLHVGAVAEMNIYNDTSASLAVKGLGLTITPHDAKYSIGGLRDYVYICECKEE
ncbi:MAG: RHS repeat-associated core domain-containing protein, partial [Planctomycetota bacterium]